MDAVSSSGDRAALVDGRAQHVHDAAQRGLAHRHRDGVAGVVTIMPRRRPSDEPSAMVRTTPSPSCCCTSSVSGRAFQLERVIHLGHLVARELHVHHGADTLNNLALT
jgi:hypothetical protein